ncbi:MAG: regulatory YrvL family protein [Turicibacter sp.]|nr:regulatory YrvL family protein [Turicibacter sp.]
MLVRLQKVTLYCIGSILLYLTISLPLIAILYLCGVQYQSRLHLFPFVFVVTILDLIAEYLGKFALIAFFTLFSSNKRSQIFFRYLLDFLMTLLIVHFVDEYYKAITLSTAGELIFSSLLLLFTAILEINTNIESEA